VIDTLRFKNNLQLKLPNVSVNVPQYQFHSVVKEFTAREVERIQSFNKFSGIVIKANMKL
jgi:hypothetical protein